MNRKCSRTGMLATALASALLVPAQGGTFSHDFNSDPSGEITVLDTARWEPAGGVDGSGYITLTDAIGSQQGSIIIPDLDNGSPVAGFLATFQLRMGGGSGNAADGFSFNFASDLPDATFGEEGTGTGLTVAIDIYDNGGGEAPAIDIKAGGVVLQSVKFDKADILTGDEFVDVRIELRNGLLDLDFRGETVYDDLIVPLEPIQGGRFGLGARTGGEFNNHWIDNLSIETFSQTAPAFVGSQVSPIGFSFEIDDAPNAAVDVATVSAMLNGQPITLETGKEGNRTTIRFTSDTVLPPGEHLVSLSYSYGTPAQQVTHEIPFTVPNYAILPPTYRVEGVDTSQPGFVYNVFQNAANTTTSSARAESALRGELVDAGGFELFNDADPFAVGPAAGVGEPQAPVIEPVRFEIPGVVNMNQDVGGAAGNFPADTEFPGIPGITGSNDGIAAEYLTYLDLPAGLITMGVNSDDGFVTTAGRANDALGRTTVGVFEGGRGAADTIFSFLVQEPGMYPFRTLWYEGGGGANIEWFTVNPDGSRVLLNDTANGGIPAYRAATVPDEPFARAASPAPGAVNVFAAGPISVELVDTDLAVTEGSVTLSLDSVATTPTVSKADGVTTIQLAQHDVWAPGSEHTATLTFEAGGQTFTREWTFTVEDYATLSTGIATAVGSGNTPGFLIHVAQSEAGLATTIAAAENQLATLTGVDNVADLSGANADGYIPHTGVINFNQDSPVEIGNFGLDEPIPGIPGLTGSTDNFAAEILTYLEFPQAGLVRMGVNSDDGFKVSTTHEPEGGQILGLFDGGRGASDSLFSFQVPQPGVYPVRLIWFEGGGGANAEWFTVNSDGTRVLVNSGEPGAIQAFQQRSGEPQPAPEISISRDAAGISITFSGTLQSAESVTGPWTNVAGASSPHSVQPTEDHLFFRATE